MQFEHAWCMPQCTPTRATLLTGQYPFRHGWINHWDVPRWGHGAHLDPELNPSLGNMLSSAGYVTCAAGKWQVNDFRVQPQAMQLHGFDDWCMWTGFEAGNLHSCERYQDPYVNTPLGSMAIEGQFGLDVFADYLIQFMRSHKEEPMFMYFPMVLTHTPFVATPHAPDAVDKEERFRAMVAYADYMIGRIVDELEVLGLRDNTLVIVTADNGTTHAMTGVLNGRQVRGGKTTLKESGICVPFIANWPGVITAGINEQALTDSTDIYPTFANIAGANIPNDTVLDGHDISSVLFGDSISGSREWMLSMGGHPAAVEPDTGRVVPTYSWAARAIRSGQWKLIYDNAFVPIALFDLVNDPSEAHNLLASEDPAILEVKRQLHEYVLEHCPVVDHAPCYHPLPSQAWDWQHPPLPVRP